MAIPTVFLEQLIKKLEQQNTNAINKTNGKNAFGCFIAAWIDVVGKKGNVAHKAPHAKKGYVTIGFKKQLNEFTKFVARKSNKVNNDENEEGSNKA